MCGGKRTTFGGQFPSSTMWVPGIKFMVIRLGGKCLYPLRHLTSPYRKLLETKASSPSLCRKAPYRKPREAGSGVGAHIIHHSLQTNSHHIQHQAVVRCCSHHPPRSTYSHQLQTQDDAVHVTLPGAPTTVSYRPRTH